MGDVDVEGLFVEASVPQQRVIDGLVFPKVLLPRDASQASQPAAVLEAAGRVSVWLRCQVETHGALLLRGFGLHSSLDFNDFVEALAWEAMPYIGLAPRTQLHSRVYTANESSLATPIEFHHENSYSSIFPSKALFFCEQEPREGANTPIVSSNKICRTLVEQCPKFFKELEEKGVIYTMHLESRQHDESFLTGWEDFLETSNQDEAEKIAASRYNSKLLWGDDRSVTIVQGPMHAIATFKEHPRKTMWWNTITAYRPPPKNKNISTKSGVTFGDGSPMPEEAIEACKQIIEQEAVDIPWEHGDVMIVDNLSVMHGRRVGLPPRKILVSLADPRLQ